MASIWKHPESKYWYANITLASGGRTNRSTRETDARKARKIAESYEAAARQKMTESQIRRVMADLYESVTGAPLASATVREFMNGWIERKRLENGERTAIRYGRTTKQFVQFLGERADNQLLFVTSKDITAFRDSIAKRLSPVTANMALKILRIALQQAYRDGLLNENPAKRVTTIKRQGEATMRRAFTLPELSRLLDQAADEWRGIILFGLYTGQRLGDLARLTWQNLHGLGTKMPELRLVTGKTGRQQIIPIAAPLLRYIESDLKAGDDPRAPLFPKACRIVEQQQGRTGSLSIQFHRIMSDAGLVPARTHEAKENGPGRSGRRVQNELSFHCLRHTATSLMKNAGISAAIVQDIIGHDSSAISAHYTHIEADAKRTALDAMPDVLNRRDSTN